MIMSMRYVLRLLAVAVAVALVSWSALAQQSPPAKSPFGVGPPSADRSLTPPPGAQPGSPLASYSGWASGLWKSRR